MDVPRDVLSPFQAFPTIIYQAGGSRNAEVNKIGDFLRPWPSLSGHPGCEYGPNETKMVGCGW